MLGKHFFLASMLLAQRHTGANLRRRTHSFSVTIIPMFITLPLSIQSQQRTHFLMFTRANKVNLAPPWILFFEVIKINISSTFLIFTSLTILYHSSTLSSFIPPLTSHQLFLQRLSLSRNSLPCFSPKTLIFPLTIFLSFYYFSFTYILFVIHNISILRTLSLQESI